MTQTFGDSKKESNRDFFFCLIYLFQQIITKTLFLKTNYKNYTINIYFPKPYVTLL